MKIARLEISNFRAVRSAKLHFDGHTLLVGANNVGKSTVCEALDLVLGPERLSKSPAIEEFDFNNGRYLEDDDTTPRPLRIEVVLVDPSAEVKRICAPYLEFWHKGDKRILDQGEHPKVDNKLVETCLRLETVGEYSPTDDEFCAKTFYSHSPNEPEGEKKVVGRSVKRAIGFIYLRALRTGARALSLDRGSLLDAVLRLGGIKTGLWEDAIRRLRNLQPPIDHDSDKLRAVLSFIEKRVAQYIPISSGGDATRLYVSQLTREHLRKTISFFVSLTPDQAPVPFQDAGTGTLNTLVLALLSFIADLRPDNVIFAMEEPEIALPPHTQRRIAAYLREKTSQCFVTSHSPYVIERFEPEQIQILHRSSKADLTTTPVDLGDTLKAKSYRKHVRRGLCEAMLGNGVIVAEGPTEVDVLSTVAAKMEAGGSNYPLDLSGITIFSADGDGSVSAFGRFFKSLDLKAYAFYDKKTRKQEEDAARQAVFVVACETPYRTAEEMLAREVPVDRQWQLLKEIRDADGDGAVSIPADRPTDDNVRSTTKAVLTGRKGDGTAGKLIEMCSLEELPTTVVSFITKIYGDFPKPPDVPLPSSLAPKVPPTQQTATKPTS